MPIVVAYEREKNACNDSFKGKALKIFETPCYHTLITAEKRTYDIPMEKCEIEDDDSDDCPR